LRAAASSADARPAGHGIPTRFWLFAGFAVLYGVCETVNGNWSQLDMTRELGASTTIAAVALTAFWAMVTVGRIGVAAIRRWVPVGVTYRVLPFLLAATFALIALLSEGQTALGVLAFALAGLGCSALLPLTISFGQEQLLQISAAATGGIIAFYQLGYGIAAFGVGPLLDSGVKLSSIYGVSAGAAVAMGLLSFAVARPSARRAEGVPVDLVSSTP
jgi:predicted MFS family arabinose efflux permease